MRVAIFTSGRHDWNILEPVVREMAGSDGFEPMLIATGIHFRAGSAPAALGGFPVAEWLDTLQASDRSVAVAQTAGWTTALLAGSLERLKADALLLVGDRTETLAAGVAAVCMRIPILHLHGGEETEGAIDNLCRHALSKLASVHFVANPAFAARLIHMGEAPERVVVTGAPALDLALESPALPDPELAARLGRSRLGRPLALCTYHSATLGRLGGGVQDLLQALGEWLEEAPGALVVMTRPNQDEGGRAIWDAIQAFAGARPGQVVLTDGLGSAYYPLLRRADFMLGNSSSGIVEALSFGLPVVNIGDRQQGRLRGPNVVDVEPHRAPILEAVRRAAAPEAKTRLAGLPNPYGDGHAARKILAALRALAPVLASQRSRKVFHDPESSH